MQLLWEISEGNVAVIVTKAESSGSTWQHRQMSLEVSYCFVIFLSIVMLEGALLRWDF